MLKKAATRVDFENGFQRLSQAVGHITRVEDLWKLIKEDLLAFSDATCGKKKEPPRDMVTWWLNDNDDAAVKETYLETKGATKQAVSDAKRAAE